MNRKDVLEAKNGIMLDRLLHARIDDRIEIVWVPDHMDAVEYWKAFDEIHDSKMGPART